MSLMMFMGGAASPFQTSITGWWSADSGAYKDAGVTLCANGEGVYQWNDRTGNGRHISQAGANRPVYTTGIVNNLPVLRVASGQNMASAVTLASFFTTTAKTLFAVAKWTVGAGSIWSSSDNLHLSYYNAATIDNYHHDGNYDIATKAMSLNTWLILTYWHDGTNVKAGITDTRTASLGSAASGTSSGIAGTLVLDNNGGSNPFVGDMAEFVTYNTALSEADRQTTERYLATKYNITLPY